MSYGQRDGISQLAQLMRDAPAAPTGRPSIDPQRRRRRRRSALITVLAIVLVLALGTASYVYWALNAPVGAASSTFTRPAVATPPAVSYVLPPVGEMAISVTGGEDYMGSPADGILTSAGGDAALPMASISKLVTAMVILDHKPLGSGNGPTITFSKADHDLYDKYYLLNATIAAMPTNSSMSEKDAISTMLVVSACNYAEAMANWAFGSQAAFLSAARSWLNAHGMTSTKMVESTGIDARNVSTPTDLLKLGKLAMADPAVAAIVGTTYLQVPNVDPAPNTNDLLGTDGINGIKTGTLEGAGSDLLFSASVGVGLTSNLQMIGVILGGDDKTSADASVTHLIESIRAGFHSTTLGTSGQVVGTYSTPWGSHAKMVLKNTADVFTWSDTPITSTASTTTLTTGKSGTQVGAITWTAGKTVVKVPVVLSGDIAPPTAQWRLTHPGELLKISGAH